MTGLMLGAVEAVCGALSVQAPTASSVTGPLVETDRDVGTWWCAGLGVSTRLGRPHLAAHAHEAMLMREDRAYMLAVIHAVTAADELGVFARPVPEDTPLYYEYVCAFLFLCGL